MLKEGIDVYIPLVDDNVIDAVVRRPNGQFVEVQIKARSNDIVDADAALFAAIHTSSTTTTGSSFYSEHAVKVLQTATDITV